jgi:hypothetical protein
MTRPKPSLDIRRFARAIALTLVGVLGLGATNFAQTTELTPSPSRIRDALAQPLPRATFDARELDLRPPVVAQNSVVRRPAPGVVRSQQSQQRLRPPASGNRGSRARQVTGAVIGAIGGFWLGAELGAALEGDSCRCDDPGMMGVVVGAPVGAAIGGVVGAMIAK